MNLTPMKDRVLVLEIGDKRAPATGVVLTDAPKLRYGVVQTLGPKCSLPLAKGDKVLLPSNGAGVPIVQGDDRFLVIAETDIVGRIEE